MKRNYQLVLDEKIKEITNAGIRPSLLLHACCAPCSSYVIEYLEKYFDITVFFYNPNITDAEEYERRLSEIKRFVAAIPSRSVIRLITGEYEPKAFFEISRGLEDEAEGGERCIRCYRMRLLKAASVAAGGGFDYFTTTLSISPHKNAQALNEIGAELAEKYGAAYLFSDFKKKNGYKRSCELSAVYGLYRQNYCGCVYSKREAQRRMEMKASHSLL